MGYSTEETYALTVREGALPDQAARLFTDYFETAHRDGELHTVTEDIVADGKVSAFGYGDRYSSGINLGEGRDWLLWNEQMEALAEWFDGTVDVESEEGMIWRWRLHNGIATKHAGVFVYPTDTDPAGDIPDEDEVVDIYIPDPEEGEEPVLEVQISDLRLTPAQVRNLAMLLLIRADVAETVGEDRATPEPLIGNKLLPTRGFGHSM